MDQKWVKKSSAVTDSYQGNPFCIRVEKYIALAKTRLYDCYSPNLTKLLEKVCFLTRL